MYGVIVAGLEASNSKYAFLSALRAAAQMVSYEVSIGFVMITVLLFAGTLNLSAIVHAQEHGWFVFTMLLPMFVIFFISSLAETQRPPFDLLEAESELVAGFMVEYSATHVPAVLPRRIRQRHAALRLDDGAVPRRLAADPAVAAHADPGPALVHRQGRVPVLPDGDGEGDHCRATATTSSMRLGWKVFLPISLLWVVLTAAWVVFGPHGGA